MQYTHMAKALLTGVVKAKNGDTLMLYVEGKDSDGETYPRTFPIRANGHGEGVKEGDWLATHCDLVFDESIRKTVLVASEIRRATKAGEYVNTGRLLGVAQAGFSYRDPKVVNGKKLNSFARGLVTVDGGAAFRAVLFDRPHGLAEKFGRECTGGSTVCIHGRLQYGQEFEKDGQRDAILEVVGLDKNFTKILIQNPISDPFLAWGVGDPAKTPAKAPEKAPEPTSEPATADDIPF